MWASLPSRSLIAITGQDKVAFLQGLLTNDVTTLGPDHPLFACLLTPQGKFLYDFILSLRGEVILLECEASLRGEILKKLSLYKLRSDVQLEALDEVVYALWEADQSLPEDAFPDPRLGELGCRLYGEVPPQGQEGSEADYILHRYHLGVPEGQGELPPQKAILLENNMDDLHAISWTKGCYMGQELTARTKYRGLVRKKLFPVWGEFLQKGEAIFQGENEVGTLMAAQRDARGDSRGLALLRLEALESPAPLLSQNKPVFYERPGWMTLDDPS